MRILTIGTFDLTHWGHVQFLKRCALFGEVMVGVNSDAFVKTFKRAPIMSEMERVHAITELGYEVLLNETSGRELIEDFQPDILIVGSDWARKNYLQQIGVDQDWLDNRNIILAYVPYTQTLPISSTEIRRRIHES